jgi:UDP-N-acetylmuramate dehydrogenase
MLVMTKSDATSLIDRLPAVRGRYRENAPLDSVTWFRVGGPAEVSFRPADRADLAEFLAGKPVDVPVTVIGVGSNLLVRDGGVRGVVVRLGRGFAEIAAEGQDLVCGAGALDLNAAKVAQAAGIGGLEFLCGVPGTIGGALRMNAGAYGRELEAVLVEAEAVDPAGKLHRLDREDFGFSYRHSAVPAGWIFLGARLHGHAETPGTIAQRMAEIQTARGDSQPIRSRTGGSTFKNPDPGVSGGTKAWQLIDRAGCRGLRRGGAMVSEQHCNFMINTGAATAADLEELGEAVRARVREACGVELEWEIRRIGEPKGSQGPGGAA